MRRITVALFAILAIAAPAPAQSRIDVLAREFSKKKDATKSKHGVTVRKYYEVVSVPWRASPAEYAGHYTSETIVLDVRAGANDEVLVSGTDTRPFEVRDARITDGVLSGLKVYRNGSTEPFEAAFLKRSDRDRPEKPFAAYYGIGILVDAPPGSGFTGPMRVFLVR